MRFADTSFWFSLQERRDPHHAAARVLVEHGVGRLLTSNHVLGETWTLVRRRGGHAAAIGFLERMNSLPDVEIVHVSPAMEADAWRWLRRHDEREYSFTDATSFALMRHRRVREALAFNGNFSAAGFIEVRPAGT